MIDQKKETTTHLEVLIDRCIKLDTKRRDSNDKRRAEIFRKPNSRVKRDELLDHILGLPINSAGLHGGECREVFE